VSSRHHVVIVGGGLTGLCTAVACASRGLRVTVLGQGVPGDGLPPVALLDPATVVHTDVWRLAGSPFALDTTPVPVLEDGEEVGRVLRVDPVGLHGAWVGACLRAGVTVRLATPVLGLMRFGGRVSGVQTVSGPVEATTTVLACGLRVPRLVAGTAGDVLLGVRTRRWALLAAAAPKAGSIERHAGDVWTTVDAVGRRYVETPAVADPATLVAGELLDAGAVRVTAPVDGLPIAWPPQWLDGLVVACSGADPISSAPAVGEAVAVGIADDVWPPELSPRRLR
jgi:glycine/D-amino acid oxidase-like deaminating enzyme